jgi:hypothetical protein
VDKSSFMNKLGHGIAEFVLLLGSIHDLACPH